jgi:septal ring factor EnvC (AmiA/AmiB activator)
MAKDTDKIIADQTKQIADLKKQLAKQQERDAAAAGEIVDYTKDLIALDKQRLDYLQEIRMMSDMIADAEKQIRKSSGESNKNKRKQR